MTVRKLPSPSPSPRRRTTTFEPVKIRLKSRKPNGLKLSRIITVAPPVPSPGPMSPDSGATENKVFPFMKLPGEIRNKIYKITLESPRQALITHLPKRATLRPRPQHTDPTRRPRRPFVGLTQVCRQIRAEYQPWHTEASDIAMDFTEINNYCATLYPIDGKTKNDAKQHMGNITIALDYVISSVERNPKGIDILPLLDRWANYYKVELGFGRYGYADYDSDTDCESKDIYRLLGRHVLPGRHVGPLNLNWKSLLEEQKFAAVRIHRQHPTEEPFIHILFKQEHKESWMTGEFSDPPANWLDDYGFDDMEHFEIKVGVIPEN